MPYEQRPIGSLCDPDHPSRVTDEPVYVAPWTCASDGKVTAGMDWACEDAEASVVVAAMLRALAGVVA